MGRPDLRRAGLALVAAWLAGCAAAPPDESALPMREFRGMWVATVANIDWPSRPGLNVERMKSEAIEILDRARDLKLNAVVLQVRPHCDALYESALEPWSWYLTGKQGQAPGDSFDPLHFWIRAAHDRGLHLHAWFNPFRALHPAQKGEPAPDSFVARNPALAPSLGKSGYRWLIPTDERVQDHALAVIRDVVRRYDVDGVHLDDYFYPYPDYLGGEEFPDAEPYAAYVADGGDLARDDWRRAAVDRFVERLYDTVKDERETVLVGISPFGIWRPGHPRSIRGFDPYVSLFADAKRWLEHGHLDYCAPQLYWPIGQLPQSFPLLLDWWSRHDREERHLWPGLNTGKVQQNGWAAREIVNQILVSRGIRSASPGHIHFSAKALKAPHLGSDGIDLVTDLKTGVYAEPALVPRTPWLDDAPPRPPATIEIEDFAAGRRVRITTGDGEDPFLFAVAIRRRNGTVEQRILPAHARDSAEFDLDATQSAEIMEIAVSAIDRLGNASPIVVRRVTSQPEDRVSTLP
jgi:uncharacterized lipoprotein YddW (UPF0748 family)